MCADYPAVGFSPSKMVDIGWHTFLLYTEAYADFCRKIAGRFIHHYPRDYQLNPRPLKTALTPNQVISFMLEKGIHFHQEAWSRGLTRAVDCQGAGCEGVCNPNPGNFTVDCDHGECKSECAT